MVAFAVADGFSILVVVVGCCWLLLVVAGCCLWLGIGRCSLHEFMMTPVSKEAT